MCRKFPSLPVLPTRRRRDDLRKLGRFIGTRKQPVAFTKRVLRRPRSFQRLLGRSNLRRERTRGEDLPLRIATAARDDQLFLRALADALEVLTILLRDPGRIEHAARNHVARQKRILATAAWPAPRRK